MIRIDLLHMCSNYLNTIDSYLTPFLLTFIFKHVILPNKNYLMDVNKDKLNIIIF